jgi:NAD-dependent deacetylase
MTAVPKRVVVLTGAGISAESGINTFRASDGLWENHRIEDVATPEGFRRNPALVHRFYNERRRTHEGDRSGRSPAEPNLGHLALARFEREFSGEFLLITQNVDALHEKAGSQNVLHMHGELLKMRCDVTGKIYPWFGDCDVDTLCDCCQKPGRLRPHIVWFGEIPFHMDEIEAALLRCDLFVAIGTSGNVYPAAGFFHLAARGGARTVELNLDPSQNAAHFDEGRYGPGTQVIPAFFDELLQSLRASGRPRA